MDIFYAEPAKYDPRLRLGDVFGGLLASYMVFEKNEKKTESYRAPEGICPLSEFMDVEQNEFCVKLSNQFLVLLTPCCNIKKDDGLLFSPLINVPNTISDHPNLKTNPLMINEQLPSEIAKHPHEWGALTEAQKESERRKGLRYSYEPYFIYDKDDNHLKKQYAINFSLTFSMRRKGFGTPPDSLLKYRLLQLSKKTRDRLSDKLSKYYTNITD